MIPYKLFGEYLDIVANLRNAGERWGVKEMDKRAYLVLFLLAAVFVMVTVAWAFTDWNCMSDCTQRYSWGYCKRLCSY